MKIEGIYEKRNSGQAILNSVQLLFYVLEVYVEGRFRKCKQACLRF